MNSVMDLLSKEKKKVFFIKQIHSLPLLFLKMEQLKSQLTESNKAVIAACSEEQKIFSELKYLLSASFSLSGQRKKLFALLTVLLFFVYVFKCKYFVSELK